MKNVIGASTMPTANGAASCKQFDVTNGGTTFCNRVDVANGRYGL